MSKSSEDDKRAPDNAQSPEEAPRTTASDAGRPGAETKPVVEATSSVDDDSALSEPTSASKGGGEPPTPGTPADGGDDKAADGGDGGSGGALAVASLVIALIVAVAVAFGGYRLWQELQSLRAAQSGQVDQQDLDTALSGLSDRLGQLDGRVANLNDQFGGGLASVSELRESLRALRESQQAMQDRMNRLAEMANTRRDDWKRSEAAYLAAVAVHRLRFYRDVDAALGALKEADALLSDFGGEAIQARKGIARAIDRLIEVDPPRVAETATRLGDLATRIDALPLLARVQRLESTDGDGQPVQAEGETWNARLRNAWRQFRDSLASLVVVSRESEVLPLRTPEERFFIRQNIKLQIEAARLAALRGDADLYRQSVKRVSDWLGTYFDTTDPAVKRAIGDAADLATARVTVELPDIAPLLQTARQFE